jgi:hypothetical protein
MYYLKRLPRALFRVLFLLLKLTWKICYHIIFAIANTWVDQQIWLDKYLTPDAWKVNRASVIAKKKAERKVDYYEADVLFTIKPHTKVNSNAHGNHVRVNCVS